MATSGSFSTNKVGNFYFTFEWYRTGYSSNANQNYIHYTLYAHNTVGNYRTVYLKNLYVNGSQVFYTAGTSGNGKAYYEGDVVTSGDMTINNSNDAGDGSFSASFEAGVGVYPSVNCTGSGSWSLDRIPRYATSNQSLNSKTETTIKMNWSSDNTIDYIWYSTNNGSNWSGVDVSDGTSGTYTISGLSANTTYNIKTRVRRKDSQLTTDSSALSIATYDYPYVKTVGTANLTIGNSQTLTLYNPLSRSVTVKMRKDSSSGTQLYSGTTSGTSITFTPTASTLYSSIPSATSGNCVYSVTYSSTTKTTTGAYTYKIKGTETPTFTTFTYKDIGGVSTTLTGNNQIVINGYNVINVTIPVGNKAVANNSATMVKYRLVCGNDSVEKAYSSSSDVVLELGYITNMTFIVYAIDSRGLSTSVMSSIATDKWKNYSAIAIKSATVERTGGVGTETTLAFQGDIWNNSFVAEKNGIVLCQYRYKKTNETAYSSYINITPTVSGNTFNFNAKIQGDLGTTGFNMSNSFNIEIKVQDKIKTATFSVLLGAGTPAMAISANGVAFGAPYNTTEGGVLQINQKSFLNATYPIGSIYLSVKSTNPSSLFGGTWVAWGTGRVPVGIDTGDSNFNSVEKTGGANTHTHTQGATGASSGSTGGPSNNTSGSTALTVAQMPSHRHHVSSRSTISNGSSSTWRAIVSGDSSNADYSYDSYTNYQGSGSGHTHTLSSHTHSLNSHTHTNPTTASSSSLQKYITCYMWKRTA